MADRKGDPPAELDLLSMALALESEGRHPPLVKRVRQAASVASAFQDLTAAKEALNELRVFTAAQRSEEIEPARAGTLGAALFAHAIILYSRATDTSPIDRWKWFGDGMLSEGQRLWHQQVMDYRDTVLAHFGHGSHRSEGPSIKSALLMRRPAPGTAETHINFIESRAGTRASLSAKLAFLIDRAIQLARERYDARLGDLFQELERAIKADPALSTFAVAHRFDRSAFLEEGAEFDLDEIGEGPHHWFKAGTRTID